ncbi:hypothetical protein cypCar_00016109 [Cyprinus carpio]|nr:hypothetical protein cypCar_00016109 [Cyprinus carpio]
MPACYCSPGQFPVCGQQYLPVGSVPYSGQSQMPPAATQQPGEAWELLMGTGQTRVFVGAAGFGAEALSETPYDSHSEPVSFPAPHSSSNTRLCRITQH